MAAPATAGSQQRTQADISGGPRAPRTPCTLASPANPVTGSTSAPEPVPPPADEFGRGTPQGTVRGFLDATTPRNYRRAMSYLDLRRTLTGKITSVGFGVDDDAFTLSGATRPADLDTEMQLLTAYLTKPGWRPEPYQQGLTSLTDNLPKLDSTPMSLFVNHCPFASKNCAVRRALFTEPVSAMF